MAEAQSPKTDESKVESNSETSDHEEEAELDVLTTKFDEICKESLHILGTMQTKMSEINEIQEQFTSSAASINSISKQVKSLINTVNTVKLDMSDPQLFPAHSKYNKSYLKTLSQSELIDIILETQSTAKRTNALFTESHEATVKHMKAMERNATDYDKIQRQRAVIKALKDKDTQTLRDRNAHHQQTQKVFVNPHEKQAKVIKARERMGTDYDKIEKQRATIRAIKEKRKQERLEGDNQLLQRNARARANNQLFSDPHEKVVVMKVPLQSQKKPKRKHKEDTTQKEKIVDPISKQQLEQRTAIKDQQEKEETTKDDLKLELEDISEDTPADPVEDPELLENELLKLNLKMLKKKCRSARISYEGSKLDMIARILSNEHKKQTKMMNNELSAQEDFMRQMAALSPRSH